MMKSRSGWRGTLVSLMAALGMWMTAAQADDFLPPEKAFAFSAKAVDANTVRLHWDIAPGYHLYRERISAQADAPVAWALIARDLRRIGADHRAYPVRAHHRIPPAVHLRGHVVRTGAPGDV